MVTRISRWFPALIVIAFLAIPKSTLAADWVNIGFGDKNIKTVFVDPKNNQHILVSLVSYIDNSYNFYTENGGTTWQSSGMGGAMTQCNNFAMNPKAANEIWAGCAVGLFRSLDGGRNFAAIPNYKTAQGVNVNISNDGVVYMSSTGNNLHRSFDGLIWELLFAPGGSNQPIVFLNKFNQNEVYVSAVNSGLYKSTNQGTSWTLVNSQTQIRSGIGQMTFDKTGKFCASVSTTGIGCSTDGGFTWSSFISPNPAKPVEYQHFYQLVQNPDDEANLLVLAGTWGGLDMKIYNYKSGVALPEMIPMTNMTGSMAVSQGVVYTWAQNSTWTRGIWRNDGIAVIPEYLKKHPVIIVPGILGSWQVKGVWTIDPILQTYTNLIESFMANGYELDKDLFVFPYDWHRDNSYTASLLKLKIDEAKNLSGSSKVDIVAHSMGGIVTRAYAESTVYGDDINQIVFLGTPHLGSPEAYPVWEAGDVKFNKDKITGTILNYIFPKEAEQNGRQSIFNYIKGSVPSVGQLLPIYNYLGWYGNDDNFTYPTFYPRNIFLESLDTKKAILTQKGIGITNIATGNLQSPIGFGLQSYTGLDELWRDGIPYNYYTDKVGVLYGLGDGTVPSASATGLNGTVINVKGVSHGDLPKLCIENVFEALGVRLVSKPNFLNVVEKYLFIAAYSPVDFYILAPDGKKVGFNSEGVAYNEIEGAFYTGNEGETEFLTIPNPLAGEYKIVAKGTGTGSYEIEATYADDENDKVITSSYQGQATPAKEDSLLVEFSPNLGTIETKIDDKTAPVTTIAVSGNLVSGYYNTDASITLSATDTESGVQKTEYSTDSIVWQEYLGPIVLTQDGETVVSYHSIDKAGNVEMEQTLTVKIDKQVPVINVNLSKFNFTHWDLLSLSCSVSDNYSGVSSFVLKLDGAVVICEKPINLFNQAFGSHMIEYTAVDKAGNTFSGEQTYKLIADYGSLLHDIAWLQEKGHFSSRGEFVSVAVHIEVSWLFDLIGGRGRSASSLGQAQSLLDKQLSKNKITKYGYDMITGDIKYILEGE